MDKQRKRMKKTIARVSLFGALKNARLLVMGLLAVDFVQRVFYHYPVTGLYILLINVLVPFLIEIAMKDKIKETKEKELPMLQESAKYNRIEYCGQGVTAVLTVVTLWAWYRKTSIVRRMSLHMRLGPCLMLIIYTAAVIVWFCRYFRAFEQRLNNNKL